MSLNRRGFLGGLFAAMGAVTLPPAAKAADNPRFTGYDELLDSAQGAKADFVLMYDTHHQNIAMRTYPLEKEALDIAARQGVKHVFIEYPRELQSFIDDRYTGRMGHAAFFKGLSERSVLMKIEERANLTHDAQVLGSAGDAAVIISDVEARVEYINRLSRGIEWARERGIKIWAADSQAFINNQRLTHHDKDVAKFIAEKSAGEFSVITYGALHGIIAARGQSVRVPGGGLDDELARHGRVMTVELEATYRPDRNSVLGRLAGDARDAILEMPDRSPQWLNVDTGEFRSDPSNNNTFVRGNPHRSRHVAARRPARKPGD